jgi:hypothetical protein
MQRKLYEIMIKFELYSGDVPAIFQEFTNVIGDAYWNKPVRQRNLHSKHNELLRDYFGREFTIAYQLATCSSLAAKYGQVPPSEVSRLNLYRGCTFAAQVLSILGELKPKDRKALIGRVRGAFKNSEDMRALLLELAVATHFVRRGNKVLWPEFEQDHSVFFGATFDLFIEDVAENGLEVECKSVSRDKGRKIHTSDMLTFQKILTDKLTPYSRSVEMGVAVILTVPARLSAACEDQKILADRVCQQVLANESKAFDDGSNIRIASFDIRLLKNVDIYSDSPGLRAVAEHVTGTWNQTTVVVGRRNVGAILVVVQSEQHNSLLNAAFSTASDAAKRQLTMKRPGLLVLGFDGLEVDELQSVAMQDIDTPEKPTDLRIGVSEFLAGDTRDHVVWVGFISNGRYVRQSDGSIETGGASYYFTKKESTFWHADFEKIFSYLKD